jgi:RNA polymerase sigma factor (TIGR02999 family)
MTDPPEADVRDGLADFRVWPGVGSATHSLMSDVTLLIDATTAGDPAAAADLLLLVYDELWKLAATGLAGEKPWQTLQTTALVHEAYPRLVGDGQPRSWNDRYHFLASAAEAMRRILFDQARRKCRVKHGGDRDRVDLDELAVSATDGRAADLHALDEVLTAFGREEPEKAELVKLWYFAGLTLSEAAACLGISAAAAKRHWALARAWLFAALTDPPVPSD